MRKSRAVQVAAAALLVAGCGSVAIVPTAVTTTTPVTASTQPPAPVTTSRASSTFDVVGAVNDAAVTACADGLLMPDELDTYRDTLLDLQVDPSSALSRTAVIVECGLSGDAVLDLLP